MTHLKIPPVVPIPSQINSVVALPFFFWEICLILSSPLHEGFPVGVFNLFPRLTPMGRDSVVGIATTR
jgi:hypothetical protein